MRRRTPRLLRHLAGVAAASGLALAGLTVAATPASAAACSGTTGVTVVVDTGGSVSTRCASGNPDSAWAALQAAGFQVTPVTSQPGAICRIDDYPDTGCQQMPPASAYWAFFHAKRGGSWTYSSTGARSYDPPSGTVVGFRFGSGQQPRVAPPAPPKTSTPAPTRTTAKPKPTTAAPKPTSPKAPATTGGGSTPSTGSTPGTVGGSASTRPSATPSPSATASASASASPSATATSSASPSETASDLAAANTSATVDDGGTPWTLLVGAALLLLVGGAAGWAAWKRRT